MLKNKPNWLGAKLPTSKEYKETLKKLLISLN